MDIHHSMCELCGSESMDGMAENCIVCEKYMCDVPFFTEFDEPSGNDLL